MLHGWQYSRDMEPALKGQYTFSRPPRFLGKILSRLRAEPDKVAAMKKRESKRFVPE
jgi:hypothetical protein